MSQIETIEAKIRELVPELMELSFGCFIQIGKNEFRVISNNGGRTVTLDDYRNFSIDRSENKLVHKSTILGHKIQLHHVLKAIEKSGVEDIVLDYAGKFWQLLDSGTLERVMYSNYADTDVYWDFSKDWSGQSEETKLFIGRLIGAIK